MTVNSWFRAFCLMATLAMVAPAQAQVPSVPSIASQTTVRGYYKFSRPGDAVIQVTAVGGLPAPGIYELSVGTSLADLLALSGGVTPDRRGAATVRLFREGDRTLEVDARGVFEENAQSIPLRDGDVIEVVGLVSTVTGYYVHTEPGRESIQLTVAGAFASPGRYTVDEGTTLGDIIALAGGLGGRGQRDSNTSVTSTVRLYRAGALAFESRLEELYSVQTQALQEGDIVDLEVVVKQRGPLLSTILQVVSTSASIVILLLRFGVLD